ncbi:MAG: Flp pilus assembly protein TadD [Gammaproteobacteria bacterium]|jgi:Flp pilus assembly protein TadD
MGRASESVTIARRYAEDAVPLYPLNAICHAALGMSYYVPGPMAEAAAAMERALELEPSNAAYRSWLCSSLGFSGRHQEPPR